VTVLVFFDQHDPNLNIPVVSLAILDNGLTLGELAPIHIYLKDEFVFTITVTLQLHAYNQSHGTKHNAVARAASCSLMLIN
jgi:hypothetical protein